MNDAHHFYKNDYIPLHHITFNNTNDINRENVPFPNAKQRKN